MGCPSRSGARPSPSPGPGDAPSARPVWTVPAIVCGGRLLGRIVLAVSNLPRPLPGHRGGPHAGPRPSPPSRQTGRPAPRSRPTFQEQPPTHPTHARNRRAPDPEKGDPPAPKPSRLFLRVSVMVKHCLYPPGARPTPSRRVGRGRPRGAEWRAGVGGRAGRSSAEGGERTSTGDWRRARGDAGGAKRGAPWGPARAGGAPPLPAAPAPRPFPRSAAAGTELTPHERAEV